MNAETEQLEKELQLAILEEELQKALLDKQGCTLHLTPIYTETMDFDETRKMLSGFNLTLSNVKNNIVAQVKLTDNPNERFVDNLLKIIKQKISLK